MSPHAVKWAKRHDWFISARNHAIADEFSVDVIDRLAVDRTNYEAITELRRDGYVQVPSQTAMMAFEKTLTFLSYRDLRNWAGY